MKNNWPAGTVAGVLKVRWLSTAAARTLYTRQLVYDWQPAQDFTHVALALPKRPRIAGRYALLRGSCGCWRWAALGVDTEPDDERR